MIFLIVAYAKNNVIGKNGHIPWDLPQDRQHFKELTFGNVVIMGRRTFEEIFEKFGRGLPGRETIILSKSKKYEGDNYRTVSSFKEAMVFAQKNFPQKDIFICGGESVYKEAMSQAIVQKIFITYIEEKIEGDAFFPKFDFAKYQIEEKQTFDSPVKFSFITFRR